MEKYINRLVDTFEALVFLEDTPGVVYLIEHFQGVAFERYEYEDHGDHFDLTLISDGEESEFHFSKEVAPDVLLASLQRYARKVS